MIELRATVTMSKPIVALTDNDTGRGGLSMEEVRAQLCEADANYQKWGFDDDGPRGEELYKTLFGEEPIEWNRIGVFQEYARSKDDQTRERSLVSFFRLTRASMRARCS